MEHNYYDIDPWQSIFSKSVNTKGTWQHINYFSQIFPPNKAYFSISTTGCWKAKPGKGFSSERELSSWLRERTVHLYPYLNVNIHRQTSKQTNVCANTIHKVRGRALPDTHRPCCMRMFLITTPLFALQLILVSSTCFFVWLLYVCAY